MATAEHGAKIFPAYVSYGTFKHFIEALKETVMPSRIDKTVMVGLSGGAQSHLTSALKFLGLINANLAPQPALETLVKSAKTGEWSGTLRTLIEPAYLPVIGDLSLETATPGLLTECFENNTAVEGATKDKAIRFYLHAAKEAKLDHSPHLAQMKVKTSYSTKPRVAKVPAIGSDNAPAGTEKQPEYDSKVMMSFPIYFKGKTTGNITVPKSISPEDCKMIAIALQMIEAYAASQQTDE